MTLQLAMALMDSLICIIYTAHSYVFLVVASLRAKIAEITEEKLLLQNALDLRDVEFEKQLLASAFLQVMCVCVCVYLCVVGVCVCERERERRRDSVCSVFIQKHISPVHSAYEHVCVGVICNYRLVRMKM